MNCLLPKLLGIFEMPGLDDVFTAARQLSDHDRWMLAHMLCDSLPPSHEWDADKLIRLSAEEIAELDRRVADMKSGRIEAIPGDVVRALLRQKFKGPS